VPNCVDKFSGKRAEDGSFEVWLDDFEEVQLAMNEVRQDDFPGL